LQSLLFAVCGGGKRGEARAPRAPPGGWPAPGPPLLRDFATALIAGGVEREQEDAAEEHKHRLAPASSRALPRLYLRVFAPPCQIPPQ
jgi:hypothetical protein